MAEPTDLEEYNARFIGNQGFEGFGLETAIAFPCPFCAAPHWATAKVIEMEKVLSRPHHCGECGRSARMITQRAGGGVQFEIVQTGGPDQPDWLPVKMRRES